MLDIEVVIIIFISSQWGNQCDCLQLFLWQNIHFIISDQIVNWLRELLPLLGWHRQLIPISGSQSWSTQGQSCRNQRGQCRPGTSGWARKSQNTQKSEKQTSLSLTLDLVTALKLLVSASFEKENDGEHSINVWGTVEHQRDVSYRQLPLIRHGKPLWH